MDKKIAIHESILSFLDDYLSDTPSEIIQKEIEEISKLNFEGGSAKDYFYNFGKYFSNSVAYTQEKRIEINLENNSLTTEFDFSKLECNISPSEIYMVSSKQAIYEIKDYNSFDSSKIEAKGKRNKKYNHV